MARAQTNPEWLVKLFPQNLQAQVTYLTLHKYILLFQNEKSAQLLRKKKFSFLIALVSVLLIFVYAAFGFACLLIYIIWYLAKGDETIYLDVSAQPTPTTVT